MSANPKIITLNAFEPFLRLLTNSNANIARTTIFGLLSLWYIIVMLIDLWYCYGFGFDLRVVAFPFAIFLNGTQLALSYASLWMNNEQIERTIIKVTKMVNKRRPNLIRETFVGSILN